MKEQHFSKQKCHRCIEFIHSFLMHVLVAVIPVYKDKGISRQQFSNMSHRWVTERQKDLLVPGKEAGLHLHMLDRQKIQRV